MSRRQPEAEGKAAGDEPAAAEGPAAGNRPYVASGPHVTPVQHSDWVERWLGRPDGSGRVLDFASGSGRHARLAAGRGFRVLAVDRDASLLGMSESKNVEVRAEDLESGRWSFSAERFQAVVMTNFLFRPRLDLLARLLAPGGRLLIETFAAGNERYGRPSNPMFLLQTDELFLTARRSGLEVVAFEQGFTGSPKRARLQRVAAVKPPHDHESMALGGTGPALS